MTSTLSPVNAKVLASVLGVTDRWVRELEKQGVFARIDRGRYDLAACVQAFIAWKLEAEVDRSATSTNDTLRAAREREVNQRVAVRAGTLMEVAEHHAVVSEIFGLLKAELTGTPARITRDLALRPAIESEINASLNRAADRIEAKAADLDAGRVDASAEAADDA